MNRRTFFSRPCLPALHTWLRPLFGHSRIQRKAQPRSQSAFALKRGHPSRMCGKSAPGPIAPSSVCGNNGLKIWRRSRKLPVSSQTAYLASILVLNTTKRGADLKGLHWRDVDLFGKTMTIRKSKSKASQRTIPLTTVACSAFARLHNRAELFGSVEPSHFVFASLICGDFELLILLN